MHWARKVKIGVGAALGAAVLAVAMLPNTWLAGLRRELHWPNQTLIWLEHRSGTFGLTHLLLFALLALALRLLRPRWRTWRMALGLLAFAVVTEVVQFAAPGRTPRLVDVRDDALGVALGMLVGVSILALVRWCRRLRHPRP